MTNFVDLLGPILEVMTWVGSSSGAAAAGLGLDRPAPPLRVDRDHRHGDQRRRVHRVQLDGPPRRRPPLAAAGGGVAGPGGGLRRRPLLRRVPPVPLGTHAAEARQRRLDPRAGSSPGWGSSRPWAALSCCSSSYACFTMAASTLILTLSLTSSPPVFEGGVPRQAEFLAADLGFRAEPGAGGTERVHCDAGELDFEVHRLGDAADGEVPGEHIVLAVAPDARGAERHLGILLDVEEVFAADVGVAVGVAGVKAGGLDAGMQAGLGQGIADVGLRRGLVETAADLADACVANVKPISLWDMSSVQTPGSNLRAGSQRSPSRGWRTGPAGSFGALPQGAMLATPARPG